jgi:NADPH:quinone reductase-like Zn-dependent oxidoreductase
MKAIVQDRFGPPEVLRFDDVDVPRIGPDDVLIRVHAASLNPYDWHLLRGDPLIARLLGIGLLRPRTRIAGADVAGVVEAVGADVRDVQPGEEVLGIARGAFAEYAAAEAARVVPKPASLTFAQAAALPMAGQTALRAIRDAGQAAAGRRVLVHGAAGGVGHCAVQIAVALGAEVTGVCGPANLDMVRGLGAARVVDHTKEDFADGRQRYDLVLDNVGNRPLRDLRRALTPSGTLVLNGGGSPGKVVGAVGRMASAAVLGLFVAQRIRPLPATWDRRHLLAVTELVTAGKLTPVVDRTYPLADVAAGLRHIETGHARGKSVVIVR